MGILADRIDAEGDGGAKREGVQEPIITFWWCNRPCNEAAPPVACPYVCLGLTVRRREKREIGERGTVERAEERTDQREESRG